VSPKQRPHPGTRGRHEYDVCLSFAGEDRAYVERVARDLVKSGCRVFYDQYQMEELWGKDLYTHLDYIYRSAARHCVMFISKHYAKKLWAAHERQSAQARAFRENREYVLPVRFDKTEIPGVRETVGYVDLRSMRPAELATLIKKKVMPLIRDEFFPPMPDKLFEYVGAKSARARERIHERAYEFFSMLRRMSRAERRLVFMVFSTGCPSEMPKNIHAQLDWLRRHLKWPPRKIVQVATGLSSLGFHTRVRGRHDHSPGGPTSNDGVLILEWHDFSVGVRGSTNGTDIAVAMVCLAAENYCTDCGWRPLAHLDFSQLSSATSVSHEHEKRLKTQGRYHTSVASEPGWRRRRTRRQT